MKFIKSLMIISALAVMLCGCGKTEQYMERGMALLKEEKYQEAAVAFENALEERTEHTVTEEEDILLYCGEAYYKSGDFENGIKIYEELISKGFGSVEVYRYLGLAQYEAGQYEQAKESYLKAVALGDVSAYGEVGKAALAMGSYEEAQAYFQIMMEEEPKNPKWVLFMGQCVLDRQEYQEALAIFEQGITLLQEIAVEQKSAQEKEDDQQLTSDQAQTNSQVQQALLYHQAICYEYLGDFETARNLFATYVTQYPDDEAAQKEYEFLLSR